MTVQQFLRLPPAKAHAAVDAMDSGARGVLEHELCQLMQAAAWKYGYLNSRGGWQPEHAAAVKQANRMLRQTRKSIGYSYPDTADIYV